MNKKSDAQRLVYPPKVWVFVKNIHGEILDLTEYVVGGQVKRLINQVSTAEVRLRNPQMIFTRRTDQYAAFHPMDPITIFMERLPGYPVQVFTGYLSTTPYLRLFPGTITLQADCTLKRLLYNYFQLAQQYTLKFFEYFGWKLGAQGVLGPTQGQEIGSAQEAKEKEQWEKELKEHKITKPQLEAKEKKQQEEQEKTLQKSGQIGAEALKKTPSAIPFAATPGALVGNDGSFSNMINALLYYVADWREENVYVEAMPDSVPGLITQLWTNFEKGGNDAAKEELETYWRALIGTGAYGKGGNTGTEAGKKLGSPKEVAKIIPIMVQIATEKGLPPEMVINTTFNECNFKPEEWEAGPGSSTGWFQFNFHGGQARSTPYGSSSSSYTVAEARDIGVATTAFVNAAVVKGHEMTGGKGFPSKEKWEEWAAKTQVSVGYPHWAETMPQIEKWISEFGKKTGTGGEKPHVTGSPESKPEEQEGGKTTSTTDYSGYHNPFEKAKGVVGERTDMGVDYHTAGSGEELVAIGDGVVTAYISNWFDGEPLIAYEITQSGPLHGQIIYYAEGITTNLRPGAQVHAGSYVATTTSQPTGLELGYCEANGKTLAEEEWKSNPAPDSERGPTKYGSMFARVLIKLGAPPSSDVPSTGPLVPGGPNESPKAEQAGGAGAEAASMTTAANAASFLSNIQFPTSEEMARALILGGQRSLMNATPVINMVQQMCEASLRSFQSLPNGDFYAFYPDYFGEFGHRAPYWEIHNIEILDGGIDLSDDGLTTHVFAVGNPIWPADVPLINEIEAGVMTIYEAFTPGILTRNTEQTGSRPQSQPQLNAIKNANEAIEFLRRYGARYNKYECPTVFSTMFESLLAYQQFMLGWARQFKTNFSFTFMPELFPGGKVAFPEHGFQMFVESVIHTWDLEHGFETTATLLAPSVYHDGSNEQAISELPPNMVEALMEPQRGQVSHQPTAPQPRAAIPHKTERHSNKLIEEGPGIENTNPFKKSPLFKETPL